MGTGLKQHRDIKWSKNLTSYQIWTVLNSLLFEAAAPLAAYGDMSVETALSCIAISIDNRRKLAVESQQDLLENLFEELCKETEYTEEYRLALLRLILSKGVERNIVVDHIAFSLQTHEFPPMVDRIKLQRHVGVQLDAYATFKQDVVFRFYYLIKHMSDKNHYVKSISGLRTTQEDMFHAYTISVDRAIDKFSPFKGTITENIKQWFNNAQGSSDFVIYDNEAYSMNRGTRKAVQEGERLLNNKAIPIHDRENTLVQEEDEGLDADFAEYTHHLARMPNAVIVFLAQSLPYTLSPDQKREILQHNREERRALRS